VQSTLQVTDKADMPILTMDKPIPNEEHPSDHLPLVFTIAFTKNAALMEMFARSWALVVLSGASSRPNDAGDDLSLAQVSATTGYSPLLDPSSTLIAPDCP
jgi:hypothetical protein